jgi:hypothetical protein
MQIMSSGVLGLEDQDVCEERREEPQQVLLALELVLVVTELVNACQCGDGVTTKNPFWSEAIFYAPHDDRDLQLREMLDGSVPNNVVVLTIGHLCPDVCNYERDIGSVILAPGYANSLRIEVARDNILRLEAVEVPGIETVTAA